MTDLFRQGGVLKIGLVHPLFSGMVGELCPSKILLPVLLRSLSAPWPPTAAHSNLWLAHPGRQPPLTPTFGSRTLAANHRSLQLLARARVQIFLCDFGTCFSPRALSSRRPGLQPPFALPCDTRVVLPCSGCKFSTLSFCLAPSRGSFRAHAATTRNQAHTRMHECEPHGGSRTGTGEKFPPLTCRYCGWNNGAWTMPDCGPFIVHSSLGTLGIDWMHWDVTM